MGVEPLEVGLEDMQAVALLRRRGVLLAVFRLEFLESHYNRIDVRQRYLRVPDAWLLL